MLNHWIITNREVARRRAHNQLVDYVPDKKREALPTFRVATFTPQPGALDGATLEGLVRFVPDDVFDNYSSVAPGTDPATLKGSRKLFKSLYDTMLAAPEDKGDTLFFIHGFNYSWQDALLHLQMLHKIYVEPEKSPIARILYFSWPSWGELTRYKSDQQIAQPSGYLLGRVFLKAIQFYRDFFSSQGGHGATFCGRRIHLGAHSMGNQVLQEFMRAVRDHDFLRSPMFGEVVLLNADADWTALEPGKPLCALPDYADRIHVYNHKSDDALLVSEATKNREKRLGRHGPRDIGDIPPRTLVVDCSGLNANTGLRPVENEFVQAAARVLGRDEPVAKERLFDHWGYLNRIEVVADLYQVFKGISSSSINGARQLGSDGRFKLVS